MRYKFIGTKQDLIKNGFKNINNIWCKPVNSWAETYYLHIKEDNSLCLTFSVASDLYDFYDGVGGAKHYIQDLIDKGLVKEIK
jgi:hypothetical protein